MKRIFLPLVLLLLLCGCTVPVQEETTVPPQTTVPAAEDPTEPKGIYVSFSDLEIQTDGSVRYFMPEKDCYGIRVMHNDVLVFSGTETTTLTRYAGGQLYALASVRLDCWIDPADPTFQISENGITYYNPDTREVVFLDNDLKEVSRLGMPGNMVGKPMLSGNRMQIYYCTADAVRVYDTTTTLDTLIKTIAYEQQSVENILLNDTVLRCALTDDRGQEYIIFISAQTGELLAQIHPDIEVGTHGDGYFAKLSEGIQELLIFGKLGEDPMVLTPEDPFARSWFLKSAGGVVTATVTQETTRMDFYDLESGLRAASVDLPGGIDPKYVEIREDLAAVLVMAYDYMADAPVILSWQTDATPVDEETVYSSPRYTAEDPDVLGLDACGILAAEIEEKYGVDISIAWEAVAQQPWDYTLELEYQPAVIRKQLESLDAVLSHFPEGFFGKLSRKPNICVVRAIRGNAESGSMDAAQGLQFWAGNRPYVALAAGDTLEGAFFHEIFHILDGKVLSDTRVYYHWENLNPEDFRYFNDYDRYLEADVDKYLQEENRAFIDAYSMCYPKEDRARIMEYACQEGNEAYFQSEVMQNKLKKLCEGIRKAFKLETYEESLLWEQYLAEPLKIK